MLEFGFFSHPGSTRSLNEDTYYADGEHKFWLVADGMGGAGLGDQASTIARQTIVQALIASQTLQQALHSTDSAILQAAHLHPQRKPMGASVVILRLIESFYEIAWVGDAHAYVYENAKVTLLTRRSSSTTSLHPGHRGTPHTQALGITNPSHLYTGYHKRKFTRPTQWLLCSDGLSENLNSRIVRAIFQNARTSAQECVDTLIATALEAGGTDNMTVILVRET